MMDLVGVSAGASKAVAVTEIEIEGIVIDDEVHLLAAGNRPAPGASRRCARWRSWASGCSTRRRRRSHPWSLVA